MWRIAVGVMILAQLCKPPSAESTGSFGASKDEGYSSRCTLQAIDGKFSPTESHYSSRGVCLIDYSTNQIVTDEGSFSNKKKGESTFDKVKIVARVEWTAVGTYTPTTKATGETVSLSQTFVDRPGYVGRGAISTHMTCAKDPWREPDGQPCSNVTFQQSGTVDSNIANLYVRTTYPPIPLFPYGKGVPLTSLVSAEQRAALNKQRQTQLALISEQAQTSPAILNVSDWPTIAYPKPQSLVVYKSKAQLQVVPSANYTAIYNYANAEIETEFTWLGGPAGQQKPILQKYPATLLASGIDFPYTLLGTYEGWWQIRARVIAPSVTNWSGAVPFRYVLTDPRFKSTVQPSTPQRK